MNVKQGNLAIVISAFRSENIGKIVTVLEFRGDLEFEGYIFHDCWIVEGPRLRGVNSWAPNKVAPDATLRPVSGLPVEDEVKDELRA